MKLKFIQLTNLLWQQTLESIRHDIYHLPEYVESEAQRIKATPEAILISDNEKQFFVPYLLRSGKDLFNENSKYQDFFDVISPYGYPGILLNESAASAPEFIELAMDRLISAFRDRGICSAFLRLHPILHSHLNEILSPEICKLTGETVSINLKLPEAEIWHQTRPEHRTKINKCKRAGMTAKMVDFEAYIHEFIEIYKETMTRVGAAESYYFSYDYFSQLSRLGEKLHLCIVELEGQVTCAGLFTECCGIVQYHLGATKNEFLKIAPSKLLFDYVRFWAKERGNEVFHLGGGLGGAKDSLYHFKAGFSKQRHNFLTLHLIPDPQKYHHLLVDRANHLKMEAENLLKTNFFPAYRWSPH